MRSVLVALALAALLAPPLRAWELVREEAGVAVSRRANGDGALPSFRGVTEIDAPLPHVLAVLSDTTRHTEWRSRCMESRVLDRPGETSVLLYSRNRGAWPIADRDVVVLAEQVVEAGGERVRIAMTSVDSRLAPPPRGAVRMPLLEGVYQLEALGPRRTRVDYQMRVDVGGRIPRFVANYATQDMPIATLSGLRRQVGSTGADYRDFVAGWRSRGD